jgi:hypothetical protein
MSHRPKVVNFRRAPPHARSDAAVAAKTAAISDCARFLSKIMLQAHVEYAQAAIKLGALMMVFATLVLPSKTAGYNYKPYEP